MSARFEGRVVLVAGGTGGLGRAASSAFLDEGADVAVTYRNQPEWEAFQNSASANAVRLQGHEVDVTDEAAVTRVVEKFSSSTTAWMPWSTPLARMRAASNCGKWKRRCSRSEEHTSELQSRQ